MMFITVDVGYVIVGNIESIAAFRALSGSSLAIMGFMPRSSKAIYRR